MISVASVLALLLPLANAPAPSPTLLVLPLEARHGVGAKQVEVMTDFMAAEARRIPGYQVVTHADIQQLLSQEVRNQLLGCNDQSCLAELGGALNADEVLFGTVGRLGRREMVLTLTRLDARAGKPISGESERLKSADPDVLLDGVPRVLKRLFPKYQPPTPRVKPPNVVMVAAFMVLVAGALQYGAFLSIFGSNFLSGCLPLQQVVFYGSILAFLAGPIYTSWLQAYLGDLIGRRQGGTLRATIVGMLMQPVAGGFTLISILIFGVVGGVITVFGNVAEIASSPTFQRLASNTGNPQEQQKILSEPAVRAEILDRGATTILSTTLATAFGVSVGILPGILCMTVAVPLAQAVAILWGAAIRSPEEDPELPGLFGAQQELPEAARKLPRWIVGGKRREDALEEPPPPKGTKAPSASPAPSPAPSTTPEKLREQLGAPPGDKPATTPPADSPPAKPKSKP